MIHHRYCNFRIKLASWQVKKLVDLAKTVSHLSGVQETMCGGNSLVLFCGPQSIALISVVIVQAQASLCKPQTYTPTEVTTFHELATACMTQHMHCNSKCGVQPIFVLSLHDSTH